MGRYYLVEDGIIVNKIVVNSPSDLPHLTLIEIPNDGTDEDSKIGCTYNKNTKQIEDPKTIDDYKNEKKAELALIRKSKESSSTTVGNFTVYTDLETQTKILGAYMAAQMDPEYTVNWKTANGFVTLNGQNLIYVAQAIRNHIQGCFDREQTLIQAIDDCVTPTDVKELIITTGWPS
jgi:hypothetical protein